MTERATEETDDSFDSETGEKKTKIVYCDLRRSMTDAETGEPELIDIIVKRKTFQIPIEYLKNPLENRGNKGKSRSGTFSTGWHLRKTNRIQSGLVQAIFLSDRPRVGPLVFVLPTLLILPTWASILCLLWEACMHIWSHRRNKRRKNRQVEYRSPLHLLSSQFCIHCRTRKWKEKIGEIQEKRALRKRLKREKKLGKRNAS